MRGGCTPMASGGFVPIQITSKYVTDRALTVQSMLSYNTVYPTLENTGGISVLFSAHGCCGDIKMELIAVPEADRKDLFF